MSNQQDSSQMAKLLNHTQNNTSNSEKTNANTTENENVTSTSTSQTIIENPLYLFVVVHTFDSSTTSITSNIINVFETQSENNEFILDKTYRKAPSDIDYNINVKNYITVNPGKSFQSRIEKYIEPRPQYMRVNEDHLYNAYQNYDPIVKIEDNECIFFYVYNNSNCIQKFYTRGSIFIFNNGIGSTRIINKIPEKDTTEKDTLERIKKIISEVDYFTNVKKDDIIKVNPISNSKQINSRIKGGAYIDTIINDINLKCKDINFLYANTILPDVLYNIILKEKGVQIAITPLIIKEIIENLYVNISAPNQLSDIQSYDLLYGYIEEYYFELNSNIKNTYDNELKKELTQFKQLKINEYIKFLNMQNKTLNDKIQYNDLNFSMHILDFMDFLNYINARQLDKNINEKITNICFTIYKNSAIKKALVQIPTITNKIKTQIEKDTKGIYTYLKITNFEHPTQLTNFIPPFNERFKIKINNDKRSMIMEYSNINMPFYVKSKNGLILNGDKLKRNSKGRVVLKGINQKAGKEPKINEIQKIVYDNKFIFGNFNQIFTPKITYEQIANNLQVLIDKILTGKPVYIMGWGASGSGKTSTLIHYTAGNQPGILIHLCKKLANNYKYTNIELVCKELFKPYYQDDDKKNLYTTNPDGSVVSTSDKFTFKYKDDKFKLTQDISYNSRHVYRSTKTTKSFTSSNDLGEVMQYLIDTDRLVKATTNNPNSSRSHVLCFLKLTISDKPENPAYIIFGDLAGVENTFKCSKLSTISKFMEVKRDGTKDQFYKNEITDNKFDVIYGGEPPYEFKDNEQKSFKTQMSNPFFNFNDEENLLKLYSSFKNSKHIVKYVNLILKQVNSDLTVENLNTQILTEGKEIQAAIDTFYNSYKENDYFSYTNTTDDIKTEFKQIIFGYTNQAYRAPGLDENPNLVKFFKDFWNKDKFNLLFTKIKECIFYNKIIQTACQNRGVEGTFINNSLRELSEDMIKIVNYKNKNTVYFLPSIVDDCLSSYCPTKKSCFSITHSDKTPPIKSVILSNIYTYLQKNGLYKSVDAIEDPEKASKEQLQFFTDIELCVFGVFNWSRIANNPPPVSYININELKQMIYKENNFTFKMSVFKEKLNKIKLSVSDDNLSDEIGKLLLEIYKSVENITSLNTKQIEYIDDRLKQIDTVNATTAVGTIEFIDNISKLNSISNSCFSLTDAKQKEYVDIYKNVNK